MVNVHTFSVNVVGRPAALKLVYFLLYHFGESRGILLLPLPFSFSFWEGTRVENTLDSPKFGVLQKRGRPGKTGRSIMV